MNMLFSTNTSDLFFTRVEQHVILCIAGEVTFEPGSVVLVVSDDITAISKAWDRPMGPP